MTAPSTEPLPQGYKLGEYIIDRRIGGGGFSLVYLAFTADGQPVAVKEYLPGGVVERGRGGTVRPISDDKENSFRYGMKCFFDEGRALANIRHPNVVRVMNFFRANDTVYMVMKYERGKTLQKHISGLKDEPMRESFIRHVFVQVLNGLREVHTHKILHLDIKPSNLYIRLDGSPVLIDFGAARQTLTQEESKLQPMYTPGFAAPEQYHNRERLGPWTDIYSIGASLYACLSGYPPQAADARLLNDKLVLATTNWRGQYSDQLLETIDHCLRLNYMERPQSVFSLQKVLMDRSAMEPKRGSLLGSLKRTLGKELF